MAQEIMTGVPGYTKVSRFTLLALEDLGYFIADYTKVDYYNYLRADLVTFTGYFSNLMSIPIDTSAGTLATVNAECLQTGAVGTKQFNQFGYCNTLEATISPDFSASYAGASCVAPTDAYNGDCNHVLDSVPTTDC